MLIPLVESNVNFIEKGMIMAFLPTSASAKNKPEIQTQQVGQQLIINAAAEDSTEVINKGSVDILIFDPPAIDAEWTVHDYIDWFEDKICPIINHCMKKDAVIVCVPRDRKGGKFSKGISTAASIQKSGWDFFRQLIWERQTADFNRSKYAFGNVFFFRRGNRPSKKQSPIAYKDIIRVKDNPEGFVGEIPEEIYRLCLSRFYQDGDVILDLFAGTGSLAAMCKKAGYKSISVELDTIEYKNIIKRLKTEGKGSLL